MVHKGLCLDYCRIIIVKQPIIVAVIAAVIVILDLHSTIPDFLPKDESINSGGKNKIMQAGWT